MLTCNWISKVEQSVPLCVAFGIGAHLLLFKRGEWHLQATKILIFHIFAWLVAQLVLSRHLDLKEAFFSSSLGLGAYAVGLFSSITVYRVFFHPLHNFAGPPLARISKLWHVMHCTSSRNHLLLNDLYHEYGDFVRTGPNELTVFHPDTLRIIYEGPKNPFTKPAWYDNLRPYTGLNTHRSKWVHQHRRRIWDRGFTTAALKCYQPHIVNLVHQLDRLISQRLDQTICVNQYFYWFSWDIMGQLAFSRSFKMLENEQWHYAINMLRRGLALVGPFTPVPWLTRIAFDIPFLATVRDFLAMEDWCARRMDERIDRESASTNLDVSSYLIGWSKRHDRLSKDLHTLYGDSIALIIAGSDTVAYTLVYIFYYLAKYPDEAEKLRREQQSVDLEDFRQLGTLQHLHGVISEALRLHPAVPTGGFRETPPEGTQIGNRWIPGNTLICAPRWTLARLESCWEKPLEFIPERWYSRPEMIRNKDAYAPFALGTYYCIGKNLAFMELQYMTSYFISKYDIRLAPGETGSSLFNDMLDQFTAAPGKLHLVFTSRAV